MKIPLEESFMQCGSSDYLLYSMKKRTRVYSNVVKGLMGGSPFLACAAADSATARNSRKTPPLEVKSVLGVC